ncbi:MAG TPA: LysR family transcriptional regulator [Xanthobacteraceae bacterium]|nr:LysR family transcriptional regulator [Xanthobacteraceae bacterium]
MRGTQFAELNAFVAVAERGNFTKAATHLRISPATLSQTIRELEERLGVRLLNRTTRSVALTEAGERLLMRLRPVLDDYEAAIDSVNTFRDKPAGLIRITMPPVPATWLVGPSLPGFLAQYPDIRVEISVTTELVDIVANHFDAGIRLGRRLERDMIAIKLGELRFAVVAAPDYLAHHARPMTPQDLQQHNCIRFRLASGAFLPWRFNIEGNDTEVEVEGSLIINSVDFASRAVQDGVGLMYAPVEYVMKDIAEGRLVEVLKDWMPAVPDNYFLYYPSRRQQPVALKALIDFLRATIKNGNGEGLPSAPAVQAGNGRLLRKRA